MLFKRLGVYALCFWVTYFPIHQAHAFAPVAVSVGSTAVRYLASEIAFDLIAKGALTESPYYQSEGKVSKSKYNSWLKGKGKYVAYIATAISSLGWLVSDSGALIKPSTPVDPEGGGSINGTYFLSATTASPQQTFYTVQQAAQAFQSYGLGDFPNKYFKAERISDYWRVNFYGEHNGLPDRLLSTKNFSRSYCSDIFKPICGTPPPENQDVPITDSHIETDFYNWVSSQPEHDQRFSLSGDDGFIAPELKPDVQISPAPTMPDGSPIPFVGHQLWVDADAIVRGIAQKDDATLPNYVPDLRWDNAYYLAYTVARGNQAITSANAKGSSLPETNPTNPDHNWSSSNPMPVVGPITLAEYTAYTDSNLAQASSSIGGGDLTGAKSEITAAMDDFIKDSVSVEVPEWEFNPFGYISFGGGQCLPFTARISIGDFDRNITFDAHCGPYEEFVRPTLEWSLYLLTALNIYMVFTRTVRSL
ncbi:hypothetical protein [Vibrio cyclitrophicus]|uniref:hypothetical protein n=1 Tax=Vibrio cyclitrophicus TaxID=47951 RepID=UPI0002EB614C|nr:hypothetical protein [Vibrio cyclitrophicus]OEF29009.1 hypothetical protein OA9_10480 [Vibrio cyclitrophicus 1F97]